MKKIYFLTGIFLFLVTGCGPAKKIDQMIASGDYDGAINLAVAKLRKKRNVKSTDKYVLLLEKAYAKAAQKDLNAIDRAKKDTRPQKWETIYQSLVRLNQRQNLIEPLLPLRVVSQNREARFDMKDYSDATVEARKHYVAYLYDEALRLMNGNDRTAYRRAYDLLDKVDFLEPHYRDTDRLREQARQNGMVRVGIRIENRTDKVLPRKLLDELTRFDSYNADNFWTQYTDWKGDSTQYDYTGKLIFTSIDVSPEREREKVIVREKEIQDGWRYQTDARGNVVKDSLGHPIKVPVYRKVTATVDLFEQTKEAVVNARVLFYDPHGGRLLFDKPLTAHYTFQHRYATYTGDQRALDNEILKFVRQKRIPFPSNEQIIYDAGMDVKKQFKAILNQADFK